MDPSFLHMDSKDSDQTGRMPRLSLHWEHMPFYWFCHDMAQMVLTCTGTCGFHGKNIQHFVKMLAPLHM